MYQSPHIRLPHFLIFFTTITHSLAQHRFTLSTLQPNESSQIPSARADHLAVVLKTVNDGPLLIVHGGRDSLSAKSDTWAYIFRTKQWNLFVPPLRSPNATVPPRVYGAVGGHRFLPISTHPFLYIALGATTTTDLNPNVYALHFKTFTWRHVITDGDHPAPRFGAAGALTRFTHSNGTYFHALLVSHGYGLHGPLSDTYELQLDPVDPYRGTWHRIHAPISPLSPRAPHPMWAHASTFTPEQDLLTFGGCQAGPRTPGLCPARDTWLLTRHLTETASENISAIKWHRLPVGPSPRVAAAMAPSLPSFSGAYDDWQAVAVLYSGLQRTHVPLPSDQIVIAPPVSAGEIDVVSARARAWLRERVVFIGENSLREASMQPRGGASLSMVANVSKQREPDEPNELYVMFGGELEDGTFLNDLLNLSFDAFVESERIETGGGYISRPVLHGIINSVCCGFVLVSGTMVARYSKMESGKMRLVGIHVGLQTLGVVGLWVGTGLVVYGRRHSGGVFMHAYIGIFVVAIATLQAITGAGGILSGMRGYGWIGNVVRTWHAVGGVLVVTMGCVNILLGLLIIGAGAIMWVQWVLYCGIVVAVCGWLELIDRRRARAGIDGGPSMAVGEVDIGGSGSMVSRVVTMLRGGSQMEVRGSGSSRILNDGGCDEIGADVDDAIEFEEVGSARIGRRTKRHGQLSRAESYETPWDGAVCASSRQDNNTQVSSAWESGALGIEGNIVLSGGSLQENDVPRLLEQGVGVGGSAGDTCGEGVGD